MLCCAALCLVCSAAASVVQADGTVEIPEVLRPYMMGIQAIKPKHTVPAP